LRDAVISPAVELEFASVAARKVRAGELAAAAARNALTLFGQHAADGYYRVIAVTDAHYLRARRWIEALDVTLRTLDALHLAVAHDEQLPLLTADRKLARSGRHLGIRIRLVS
jgi:predicted nucleic acid-binding protein